MTFLDGALRTLTLGAAVLPDLLAAHITSEALTLIVATDSAPPGVPWERTGDNAWTLARTVRFPDSVFDPETRPAAPYPCLVTVGGDDTGEWLIDIEKSGALTLTGDADRTEQLARYMAAELASNTWSDHLILTVAGFGDELVAGNPRRVAFTNDLPATAVDLIRDMADNMSSAAAHGLDVLTGRLTGTAGDLWMPHVLLAVPSSDADRAALADVMAAAAEHPGRTAVAVVAATDDHIEVERAERCLRAARR